MQDFVYQSAPMRVVFGTGTLRQLPDELTRLGVSRALVLATPRQKDLVAGIREMIGERFAGVFTGAVMHTPVEVTQRALDVYQRRRATARLPRRRIDDRPRQGARVAHRCAAGRSAHDVCGLGGDVDPRRDRGKA